MRARLRRGLGALRLAFVVVSHVRLGMYQRYFAFASLQLMTSLAAGRTIANVNPPAAVPQITGADT
jgi:hypothetical protein